MSALRLELTSAPASRWPRTSGWFDERRNQGIVRDFEAELLRGVRVRSATAERVTDLHLPLDKIEVLRARAAIS